MGREKLSEVITRLVVEWSTETKRLSEEEGDEEAMFLRANYHLIGYGVFDLDKNKSLYWLEQAEAKGHEPATAFKKRLLQDFDRDFTVDNYFMTSENISQSRFDAVEESLASIRRLSECMVNGIGNISENAPPSKEEREARSAEAAAALQEVFNGALSFIDSLPDERFEPDLPEYQKLLETAVSEHSEAAAALQQEIIKSSEVHKQAISKLKSEVETKYTAASTTTT